MAYLLNTEITLHFYMLKTPVPDDTAAATRSGYECYTVYFLILSSFRVGPFLAYLDSRLTGGGEVVNLTLRPPFTPQDDS
jgi:hypothetical protein